MRAVGYFAENARRNGQKRSIAEQNHAFGDFCIRHGYEVAGTFLDTTDEQGATAGFAQMLHFLARPDRGFVVVAVDSLGVLGPDLGQAALKLLEIEQTGCQVLIAHTGHEAFRELVDTWADRGDGTPISEKVRSAMRRKAVRGEVLGRPPTGTASARAGGSNWYPKRPSSSATSSGSTSRKSWESERSRDS